MVFIDDWLEDAELIPSFGRKYFKEYALDLLQLEKVSPLRLNGGKRVARALIQEHLGAEIVVAAVNQLV